MEIMVSHSFLLYLVYSEMIKYKNGKYVERLLEELIESIKSLLNKSFGPCCLNNIIKQLTQLVYLNNNAEKQKLFLHYLNNIEKRISKLKNQIDWIIAFRFYFQFLNLNISYEKLELNNK